MESDYTPGRFLFDQIPFQQLGANPKVQDIFLEIDYLRPLDQNDKRTFRPKDETLRNLSDTFRNAGNQIEFYDSNNYVDESRKNEKKKILHIDLSNSIPYRRIIGFNIYDDMHRVRENCCDENDIYCNPIRDCHTDGQMYLSKIQREGGIP